jgi:phosphoribosylformylglycinamidine cyclo-ligase
VDEDEMYHVFNMGIGMVVICSSAEVNKLIQVLPGAKVIGQVTKQSSDARVIIK